jgi:CMP-N-acetylneuraminic acid synthetase
VRTFVSPVIAPAVSSSSPLHVLAVVPARGGSKGVPRKNVRSVAGRPLIGWTFEAARGAATLARVVVSTDDPEIAEVARAEGIEVPFLRPPELAADETPMVPVLQHLLRELEAREGYRPDALCLLQPTSPLRRAEHVDAAVTLLAAHPEADAVVSVVAVPHHFHPWSVMHRDAGGYLQPFVQGEGTRVLRRQDKPVVWARNGAAVYVVRRDVLLEQGSMFGQRCLPLEMTHEDSVDVDTIADLQVAEAILASRAAVPA